MARPKELTAAKRRDLAGLTHGFRGIVVFLFLLSGIINVLALTGSIYMMQIYDRALTSGSVADDSVAPWSGRARRARSRSIARVRVSTMIQPATVARSAM